MNIWVFVFLVIGLVSSPFIIGYMFTQGVNFYKLGFLMWMRENYISLWRMKAMVLYKTEVSIPYDNLSRNYVSEEFMTRLKNALPLIEQGDLLICFDEHKADGHRKTVWLDKYSMTGASTPRVYQLYFRNEGVRTKYKMLTT